MRSISRRLLSVVFVAGVAAVTYGCGDFIRQDRSSVTLVIDALEGASGAKDELTFTGTLDSDVLTKGGITNDSGRVTMRMIAKDAAQALTATNAVTIDRYRVTFRRSDGRNAPGVDVPHPFDSALTFTVTSGTTAVRSFELIRHTMKLEAPLLGLRHNNNVLNFNLISTVADITFFGHDQAGRELSVTGSIGIQFGDFADPEE